jgi:hypothetical protein
MCWACSARWELRTRCDLFPLPYLRNAPPPNFSGLCAAICETLRAAAPAVETRALLELLRACLSKPSLGAAALLGLAGYRMVDT